MLRAVVDVSTWIQALTNGQNGKAVVDYLAKEKFELCLAEPLITELENVLRRRKFDNIPFERKERLCNLIREKASVIATLHVALQIRKSHHEKYNSYKLAAD